MQIVGPREARPSFQDAAGIGGGSEMLVTPGQMITLDMQHMRGHGTYVSTTETALVASVAGRIERVNKLISVKPLKTRFNGEIGDVVVGRIIELGPKRWRVDIKARQDAILMLSSINLPGGVQRKKTESDEMEMRSFFSEGDLLSAEVQNFFGDGAASLHTRNIKYGKLRNGTLVIVPSALVQRAKSHFITLPCGVDLVLGLNGYIHVAKHVHISPEMANQPEGLYGNQNSDISDEERLTIARVCNVIAALADFRMVIHESIIVYAYEASLDYPCQELLKPSIRKIVLGLAQETLAASLHD
ncbi:exosome non-catalytic core subunit rrp4 [Kappamyces sp. JEL0829]|nr:exosome non-catalytic core subunit rrp4 [Kappamyces sp. JEL0829]